MKHFILATLCLLVLIVPWTLYNKYSLNTVSEMTKTLDYEILHAIESGDWHQANKTYSTIIDDWQQYHKASEFFLNSKATDEAYRLIYKVEKRIQEHDSQNAPADLAELSHCIKHLYDNERLTPGNIL